MLWEQLWETLEPPRTSSCSLHLGPCNVCGQRLLCCVQCGLSEVLVEGQSTVSMWPRPSSSLAWGPKPCEHTDSGYHSHTSGWGQGCHGGGSWGQGTISPECPGGTPLPPVPAGPPALPQLPLVAWGTSSLIKNGENLEAKGEKELQDDP